MQRLPVDISTFSELRISNYLYVDKTQHIYRMITGGRRFFLSRPRRFGKSLLISTFKEILSANKDLFNNLWIAQSDYSWQKYGIINLDFSSFVADNITLFQESLERELLNIAQQYHIIIDPSLKDPSFILKKLVPELFKLFGRVALLIDEYDNPILKTLHNENLATLIRDKMQHFFTTIKSLDAEIQFVFITGVSSFAKAGLFSGINNVQMLTLQEDYATICGYTDTEVDYYFTQHIVEWAHRDNIAYEELRQKIKSWYNGYHFGKNVAAIYNPFSLMNALNIKQFDNFWFQSGTPSFLVKELKKQNTILEPEDLHASKDFLGIFDVNNMPLISLMFQTGYLTIAGYDYDTELYQLNYPNLEVKRSFQKYLLEAFAHINPFAAEQISNKLRIAFYHKNFDDIIDLIKQLFAHIPYQLHSKQEKFYHALFMMICIGAGIKAQSEYSTSHGRIDLVIETPNFIYIIEIKFNEPAEVALAQIKNRRYYERFLSNNKSLILLGLSFIRKPHSFDITYAFEIL